MNEHTDALQMTDQDLELLSQYVDGELPAKDAQALEQRLQSEPTLASGLDQIRLINERLRVAFSERDDVPESIRAQVANSCMSTDESGVSSNVSGNVSGNVSSNVLPFPSKQEPQGKERLPRWAYGAAASLVGAIALGMVISNQTQQSPLLPSNDALVSETLDTLTSDSDWFALGDGRELKTVLTFPHHDGRWCREYLLRGQDSNWRAVSCRSDGQWVTQAAGREAYLSSAANAYRPAGAVNAEPVEGFISQHAADIALGLDEERAVIGNGWEQ